MNGPLRSLLIGDVDFYPSEYIFGVNQGMTLLNHWHATVNVRHDLGVIWQRVMQVQPHVLWCHMLLWAPGENKTEHLLELCRDAKRRWGTRVIMHDGDARVETRYPVDVSSAVDVALCNHTADRSAWNVTTVHWPYFAFVQSAISDRVPEFTCDLAFAGRRGGGIYTERSALLGALRARLGPRFLEFPSREFPHTLFRTAELAATAHAVLGWGRTDTPGWTDVRVFQYPGAGGVLLHDDALPWLTPFEHFVPVIRGDVDSIVEALDRIVVSSTSMRGLRERAFAYVQREHSSLPRILLALRKVGL